MKNIIKSTMLLVCSVLFLASCSDDNASNPTLQTPNTFKLNTPSYSNQLIDLATSTGIDFTWSQPAYGFPAAAEYQLEFSLENKWTTSTDQALADQTGATIPDYTIIDDVFTTCKGQVSTTKLARGLQIIAKWASDAVPNVQKVYVRCTSNYVGKKIASNVVEMTLSPYYVELKDAEPQIWYLVGACIGDGKWNNSDAGVGISMIPMFTIPGKTYDKVTGGGEIQYTGYFPDNAKFKIIETVGDWNYGMCGDGKDTGGTTYRAGKDSPDLGNIKLAKGGYYNILVNTTKHECTITPVPITPTVFTTITMPGSYQGWDASKNELTAISSVEGVENHDWTATATFDADAPSDGGLKFAIGNSDKSWGAEDFPRGTGVIGGKNIPFKAGTYKVFFNDILAAYQFIAQ